MNNFYGYEVQSHGTTISWTMMAQEAEKAFKEAHGDRIVMYKHNGQTKVAVKRK